MITVEWCSEDECLGADCPRYQEQKNRWPRTIAITVKLPLDVRSGRRAMVRRQAMQDIYLNGVTDGNGGPLHLTPSVAAYEVHPLGVQYADADGVPYVAVYASVADPIELALQEPVIEENMHGDANWAARRRELGELFVSEVLR